MNIVYAAGKPSIAGVLSDHLERQVSPQEIDVAANPDETGSFLVVWEREAFLVTPSGDVLPEACAD